MLMKKKSCPLIKVNKKNTLLKENINKISYVSEAIKKKMIEKKKMIHLHTGWNHHTGWNLVEWATI